MCVYVTCVYMYVEYVTQCFSVLKSGSRRQRARGCFYRIHSVFHVAVADRFMGQSVKKVDPFSSPIATNKHLQQHQSPLAMTA